MVTGAASGIGRALAERFHSEGARVVFADRSDAVGAIAEQLAVERPGTAIGVVADVGTEAGNVELIRATEAEFGTIDLFFANAGVGLGVDLDTDEAEWELAFAVNTHAHRWAAKHLLPAWLERGEGYFCSTASAAGLLTQIGSLPYSMTKHAAVAFAEWLAITYGERGVRVSCLCPMGVDTAMLNPADPGGVAAAAGDVVRAAGAVLQPDEVAEVTLAAIREERFLVLPHPEVATFFQRKATDHDRWITGMRRLQSHVTGR